MKKKNNTYIINELKEELITSNFSYSYLILNMLNKEKLNKIINKINNTKTKIKITTITKKEYLTNNEQFLNLLNNFICIFKENFYFLQNNSDYIIEILLQNEKYTKFLLSKKYFGNNKYIPYFTQNIKKLIIYDYYNNLKFLNKKSEIINKFINENNINIKKGITHNKEIEIIYNSLLKLSISNAKELNNYQLFENIKYYISEILKNSKTNEKQIIKSVEQIYITNWEFMIKSYNEKKEAIKILLK